MKVLQIGKYYRPYLGGIETHLYDLCIELLKSLDVEVVVANTGWKTIREKIDGVSVTRVGRVGTFASTDICPTYRTYIKNHSCDIVHMHFPNPMAELAYLFTKKNHKLVVTYHSDVIRQKFLFKLYKPLAIWLLKRADLILVQSEHNIEGSQLLERFLHKVRAVPLGIDTKVFDLTPDIKKKVKEYDQLYGKEKVLFIGRLVESKGVGHLIRAMKNISAHLIIIGWGPLERELKELCKTENVQSKVTFIKKHTEKEKVAFLHACSLLCLPALYESFGLVQLEAMICEKPVINTDLKRSAAPFVSKHNESGLTVAPGNCHELADAINKILSDDVLGKKLGQAGRQKVLQHYTKEQTGQKILSVYKELMQT